MLTPRYRDQLEKTRRSRPWERSPPRNRAAVMTAVGPQPTARAAAAAVVSLESARRGGEQMRRGCVVASVLMDKVASLEHRCEATKQQF